MASTLKRKLLAYYLPDVVGKKLRISGLLEGEDESYRYCMYIKFILKCIICVINIVADEGRGVRNIYKTLAYLSGFFVIRPTLPPH